MVNSGRCTRATHLLGKHKPVSSRQKDIYQLSEEVRNSPSNPCNNEPTDFFLPLHTISSISPALLFFPFAARLHFCLPKSFALWVGPAGEKSHLRELAYRPGGGNFSFKELMVPGGEEGYGNRENRRGGSECSCKKIQQHCRFGMFGFLLLMIKEGMSE